MLGVDALSLLHQLASSPSKATDALKLLHELQVHQVELDLQHDQMEQTRHELATELERYIELYDSAPIAYLTVEFSGKIIDGNFAAARLLGLERGNVCGIAVETFLTPASRVKLLSMLAKVRDNRLSGSCIAQINTTDGSTRPTLAIANLSPDGQSLLLLFIEQINGMADLPSG